LAIFKEILVGSNKLHIAAHLLRLHQPFPPPTSNSNSLIELLLLSLILPPFSPDRILPYFPSSADSVQSHKSISAQTDVEVQSSLEICTQLIGYRNPSM